MPDQIVTIAQLTAMTNNEIAIGEAKDELYNNPPVIVTQPITTGNTNQTYYSNEGYYDSRIPKQGGY